MLGFGVRYSYSMPGLFFPRWLSNISYMVGRFLFDMNSQVFKRLIIPKHIICFPRDISCPKQKGKKIFVKS